ncbi:MAG: thioredoxin domain-containing protein [Patescibacteria group bacterium]|nr:thioredoxin domain-containing protein [Patescibacteria group bacterium]
MSKKNKIIIFVAVILALAGLVYLAKSNRGGEGNLSALRPIDATDHLWGRSDAPVQMIIYSDFECPFCQQFTDTVKKVAENFPDKVAISFRHYPLSGHAEAGQAAEASECAAEQGKFWEMYDKLFADNLAGRLSAEQYKKDAGDLGLDAAKFNQCLDDGKYKSKVAEEMAEGGQAGVTGTPTTFVNGNIYPGAYPYEDFTAPNGDKEAGMKTIISNLLK